MPAWQVLTCSCLVNKAAIPAECPAGDHTALLKHPTSRWSAGSISTISMTASVHCHGVNQEAAARLKTATDSLEPLLPE